LKIQDLKKIKKDITDHEFYLKKGWGTSDGKNNN